MKKIFQLWLFLFVLFAFVVTLFISYKMHSSLAENSAKELLRLRISDAKKQIIANEKNLQLIKDLTNSSSLAKVRSLAQMINANPKVLKDTKSLEKIKKMLEVDQLHISDEKGILIASIPEAYKGYNMASSKQSKEFLGAIVDKNFQLIQPPQKNGILNELFQYIGVARIDKPGIVQIGFRPDRLEKALKVAELSNVASIFRIGNNGTMTIEKVNNTNTCHEQIYSEIINGKPSLCMRFTTNGYRLTASIPEDEMYVSRNSIINILVIGNLILFGVIFILISRLLQHVVINGIYNINKLLSEITKGNLSTKVEVETSPEFKVLSTGINSTVEALKSAIEAEAKRLDKELELGRTIQTSSLPNNFPDTEFYSLAASMHTAKEVGGDFYDFFMVDENHLAMLIADVSGKGITAALYMMTAKTLLKELTQTGKSPDEIFVLANKELANNNKAHMFLTAFLGILNIQTGELVCVNAGHNPPLLKTDDWNYLNTKHGLVLGASKKARYQAETIKLESGNRLFLYTDGVTEAMNPNNEQFGEDRLKEILVNNNKKPNETLKIVYDKVKVFASTMPQSDDITMLMLDFYKK